VDEAAMVDHLAWKVLIGRLRQTGYEPKAWITTTPKGRNWVWREWVSEPKEGYELIPCRTEDNPYLTSEFIGDLKASYSGVFYQQELLGEFVGFEGMVYPQFSRTVHVADCSQVEFALVVAGVDWGFTNPAVILVVGVDGDGRLYVVDEFYERRRLIDDVAARAREFVEAYKVNCFCCDPSEPAYIETFRRMGLNAVAGNNEVTPGINALASRLGVQADGRPRLFVDPRCVNVVVEFENYRYPESREGAAVKEQPLKVYDHALDALRYVAMHLAAPRFRMEWV